MVKRTTCFSFLCVLLIMGFVARGQQLHNSANAASIANEANTTTGWIPQGATLTSVTGGAQLGSFYLRLTSTAQGRRVSYTFSATVGQVYVVRIWARAGTQVSANPSPAFTSWVGVSGLTTRVISGTVWAEYVFTVTATTTQPQIRIFTGNAATQGVAGNTIEIDNVSILPGGTDTTPPSAPANLLASNITATSTNLSWTAATDNVGVTNYRIYNNGVLLASTGSNGTNFLLTGLSPATPYNLMVRAVDAAGNESANSNAQALVTSGNMDVPYTTANANLTTVDWKTHDLLVDGNLGIGITNTMGYKLAVNGGAIAESVRVKLHTNWPDFVFVGNYDLPDLTEVERHIHEQGHLIGIPSATEMQAEGIDLGDMNARLLQKIEELTLYILQQDKRIQNLEEDKRKL